MVSSCSIKPMWSPPIFAATEPHQLHGWCCLCWSSMPKSCRFRPWEFPMNSTECKDMFDGDIPTFQHSVFFQWSPPIWMDTYVIIHGHIVQLYSLPTIPKNWGSFPLRMVIFFHVIPFPFPAWHWQGLVSMSQCFTSPYCWGYNIQQIFVLLMWNTYPQ